MKPVRLIIVSLFVAMLVAFNACKPESCLHGDGDSTSLRVETDSFAYISIRGMFDVILVQDTTYYIEFQGGSKALEYVQAVNDKGNLVCSNTNSCSVLRGYKKIKLYIHFIAVKRMDVFETSKIISEIPITGNFYFTVQADMAEVNLLVDCDRLDFWANMTSGGVYTFRGKCNHAGLEGYYAAKIDSHELDARDLVIKNYSVADFNVYATDKLTAEIHNKGNIYYSGDPAIVIDTVNLGSGKLISATK